MRILALIPHFYDPEHDKRYGSSFMAEDKRMDGLHNCLHHLLANVGKKSGYLDFVRRRCRSNGPAGHQLDVALISRKGQSLTDRQENLLPPGVRSIHTDAPPKLLGFVCHHLMTELKENYDWFIYLEDDLIIHDSEFFEKLRSFEQAYGDKHLLVPNRYEFGRRKHTGKIYIDDPDFEDRLHPLESDPLYLDLEGRKRAFMSPMNTHAGLFAVSKRQLDRLIPSPFFGRPRGEDRVLEQAASAAAADVFTILKPSYEDMGFLEVEHFGEGFSSRFFKEGTLGPGPYELQGNDGQETAAKEPSETAPR
ncbi:hypothetical protein ACTL6U_21430 [Rhodovibrionaceae bacterium A322]